MSQSTEALEIAVLQLPTEERTRLLDRLVASLDSDRARDAAWDQLAAQRDASIEGGSQQEIPGPDVIARLRARLK
ncbi:hypothetical protein CKO42_15395 [Lamprobacter modestohalophilus]|uniref:Addiction module protein n=1 Tax=Lamprobacter modestohalophilus TaxID=1064514 RepID=A0A9X0WBC6_9GAMM|nr:addiction module protein [Lamprobacter modestohalophilus]MBK1619803.1 hypothetical protein [Lamprobacter modestohalophilus]MCF8005333.1 addiction module protein [Chromatiaceae bacterium]MCF8016743.1 addiction module protein [Chromatiaceae bacterium]